MLTFGNVIGSSSGVKIDNVCFALALWHNDRSLHLQRLHLPFEEFTVKGQSQ